MEGTAGHLCVLCESATRDLSSTSETAERAPRVCAEAESPGDTCTGWCVSCLPGVAVRDTEHQNVWHEHTELGNANPCSKGELFSFNNRK